MTYKKYFFIFIFALAIISLLILLIPVKEDNLGEINNLNESEIFANGNLSESPLNENEPVFENSLEGFIASLGLEEGVLINIEDANKAISLSDIGGSSDVCFEQNTILVKENNRSFETADEITSYVAENINLIEEKLIENLKNKSYLLDHYYYKYTSEIFNDELSSNWDLINLTYKKVECGVRCFGTLDGCSYLKAGVDSSSITTDHLERYFLTLLSEPFYQRVIFTCNYSPGEHRAYPQEIYLQNLKNGTKKPLSWEENPPCGEYGIREVDIELKRTKIQVLVDKMGNLYAEGPTGDDSFLEWYFEGKEELSGLTFS